MESASLVHELIGGCGSLSTIHGLPGNAPVGESPQNAEWQPMRTLILATSGCATGRAWVRTRTKTSKKKTGADAFAHRASGRCARVWALVAPTRESLAT